MPPGFEPAGGIDGQLTIQPGLFLLQGLMPLAHREESGLFALDDLQDSEGIVQFGHLDVSGLQAGHPEGGLGGQPDRLEV